MFITGDTDRPPLRISIPQAGLVASANASTGTLVAHYYRQISGRGQHVDVSMQEAVARVLFMEPLFWEFQLHLIARLGPKIHRANVLQTELWRCKDGLITMRIFTGTFGKRMKNLVDWMEEEGMAGILKDIDWEKYNMSDLTQEESDQWEATISKFFMKHTMAELHKEAQKRWIFIAPCYTTKEIAEDEQLSARDYWVKMEHPEWDSIITYPGAPCKASLTPWKISRRAPLIGEHNDEIYVQELGFSREDLVMLRGANVI